jgi:rubrerythrin
MRPPLQIVPPGPITSADELMAIAHAMEREAARRYHELAARMRLQGEDKLAALFTFLAGIEDKHAHQVDARAQAMLGHAPDPATVRWVLPENFDEEEARSAALSPYRALAIAVRNEERTFAFYAYLAAATLSPELQQLAEEFAKDELEHASLLRRERRKAWRTEGGQARAEAGEPPQSVAELLAQVVPMEHAAAAAHRALAARLRATEQESEAAVLFEHAAADEEDLARSLEGRLAPHPPVPWRAGHAASVRDGLGLLEYAFERYSDFAERVTDEATMLEAQALTERALRRLAYVHGSLSGKRMAA